MFFSNLVFVFSTVVCMSFSPIMCWWHKLYNIPCILYMCVCAAVCGCVAEPRSLFAEGRKGWMASQSRHVGVKLRAPNYSAGSYSMPASPSAPMFGCIFTGWVRWYTPLVSKALVSGGLHLSTKPCCVWLADLNEIPIWLAILSFSLLTFMR